jgi:type IV pilus assembly protein PilB
LLLPAGALISSHHGTFAPERALVPCATVASPLTGRRRRLGELLIDSQLISEEQLKAALHEQKKWGGRLGRTVVEMGFVTESAMVTVLAGQLQLRTVDLDAAKLPVKVTEHLRLDLAERYGIFPLGIDGNTLFIASSDPTNLEQLQELEFATNKKIQVAVATASSIERAIRKYYFGEKTELNETIHPRNLGVTMYELDDRTPSAPGTRPSAPQPGAAAKAEPPPPARPPSGPVPGPAPLQPVAIVLDVAAAPAAPAAAPVASPAAPAVTVKAQAVLEAQLRKEIAVLREQVDALETISGSQVRALRALLEILIESGLVTRDEYLARLHARDS